MDTDQRQTTHPIINRLFETLGDADDVCRVVTDHIRTCAAAKKDTSSDTAVNTAVKQSPPVKMEAMLDRDVARTIVAVQSETIEVQLQLQSGERWITLMPNDNVHTTVVEKIGCRVGLINTVAFGDEQVPKEASFASIEIDDGGRLNCGFRTCDGAAAQRRSSSCRPARRD